MMKSARRLVSLALAASAPLVAACTSSAEAPSLAQLDETIFTPKCTKPCHSGGEFAGGGLDFKPDLYTALMHAEITAPQCVGLGLTRVAPGNPSGSLLYQKILAKIDGATPPCGEPMPLGENMEALADDEVESIRAWIEDGAKDD